MFAASLSELALKPCGPSFAAASERARRIPFRKVRDSLGITEGCAEGMHEAVYAQAAAKVPPPTERGACERGAFRVRWLGG